MWKYYIALRHITPLGHIIPIPSVRQPVFAVTSKCYASIIIERAINTSFIVFGLTRPEIKPSIFKGQTINCYFNCLQIKLLTRLIHPFTHFYIVFIYYLTCSRPEYCWNTACFMLSNNQSIITIALHGVFLCKAIKFCPWSVFLSGYSGFFHH
jgi:hypothetical protein